MEHIITPKGADVRPKSTREVVAYLRRAGLRGVLLNKGPGYFCFEGPPTDAWLDHTVHVSFLANLTLDQWLQAYRAMDGNPANRQSVLTAARKP